MFRPLLAALLTVAVLASPVLSAEACALACAAMKDDAPAMAHIKKDCCSAKNPEHRSKTQSPSKSDSTDDDCSHCQATCCRPVTMIEPGHLPIFGELPAISVEAAPLAAREFVAHDPIFHPPRA